jgi:hypothetical protein
MGGQGQTGGTLRSHHGDFNKSYASLTSWAAINTLTSLSRDLYLARQGDNFASFNGTTTVKPSLIDHIFLQDGTPFTLNSAGGLMHPTLLLSRITIPPGLEFSGPTPLPHLNLRNLPSVLSMLLTSLTTRRSEIISRCPLIAKWSLSWRAPGL